VFFSPELVVQYVYFIYRRCRTAMAETTIKIGGMSCQHCIMAVKKAVTAVAGVSDAEIAIGSARITFDEKKTSRAALEAAVIKAGYKVEG
jgi:copper chaperone